MDRVVLKYFWGATSLPESQSTKGDVLFVRTAWRTPAKSFLLAAPREYHGIHIHIGEGSYFKVWGGGEIWRQSLSNVSDGTGMSRVGGAETHDVIMTPDLFKYGLAGFPLRPVNISTISARFSPQSHNLPKQCDGTLCWCLQVRRQRRRWHVYLQVQMCWERAKGLPFCITFKDTWIMWRPPCRSQRCMQSWVMGGGGSKQLKIPPGGGFGRGCKISFFWGGRGRATWKPSGYNVIWEPNWQGDPDARQYVWQLLDILTHHHHARYWTQPLNSATEPSHWTLPKNLATELFTTHSINSNK